MFLGFSAVNTGNNLVYLIVSAFLSFMGISGLFGKRNISRLDAELEFPDEIYSNKPVPIKVTLSNNKKFLPGFLLKVIAEGYFTEGILFPYFDARSSSSNYMGLSFRGRGRHEIKKIYVSSVFPFNFFVRSSRIEKVFSFIVFPEPRKCDFPEFVERQKKPRGERSSDKRGYESEVMSVRDYIAGDPLKYINWKASAKTGDLKTKELTSLYYQPVVVDFDKVDIKDLEEKISCMTYTVLQLARRNIPFGFRISGKLYMPDVSNSHKISILKELALYGT